MDDISVLVGGKAEDGIRIATNRFIQHLQRRGLD